MNPKELKILEHFLDRTSMWINPIDRATITSFVHGFEAGTDNKAFTSKLKKLLETEHNIYGSNQGWPNQVFLYAEKRNMKWSEAFNELGKEILDKIINGKN
ncbi:hypothetical protein [Psychroserpens sp. SPM9]|uniref:hypothetical protein n=1 Tax=Psychroserpens sp. SPM9 TaxID=2975598 RepID=UPI0021A5B37F|nr:hypothetical protein [Psychroserpens sp. SPM9]MDG5493227.1 hypothetical protein [Psychroserpens sp. SPM9]